MVKGQVQVVDVKYGDFSEASCPFDVTGIVAWMKLVSIDETSGAPTVESFSFDVASEELQKELFPPTGEGVVYPLTLIAVFSDPTETSYVTFNADKGYFGDKEDKITQIVVPVANGTTANNIPQPVNPTPNEESSFFAFWINNDEEYKFTSSVTVKGDTSLTLTAEYVDYDYSITLKVNGNEYMVIYFEGSDNTTGGPANSIVGTNVAGVEFNGNVYTETNIGSVSSVEDYSLSDFIKENIIPSVSGYDFIQYKDGNKAA